MIRDLIGAALTFGMLNVGVACQIASWKYRHRRGTP
jgi:hypothetical protein